MAGKYYLRLGYGNLDPEKLRQVRLAREFIETVSEIIEFRASFPCDFSRDQSSDKYGGVEVFSARIKSGDHFLEVDTIPCIGGLAVAIHLDRDINSAEAYAAIVNTARQFFASSIMALGNP